MRNPRLPLPRYRGPFFRDPGQDQQQEPNTTIDDQNLPPPDPDMQFMPATPAQVDQYNPNVGDPQAFQQWLDTEVFGKGYSLDVPRGVIINPDTGEVVGPIPQFYPRT